MTLLTRCFKDLEGTIPCEPGDPVALMIDPYGNEFIQPITINRPLMSKDGGAILTPTRPNEFMESLTLPTPTHTLNSSRTVAVSREVYWLPITPDTPRGVKLQLLGQGGVAHYGTYFGDPFWTHWQAVPKLENKHETLGN